MMRAASSTSLLSLRRTTASLLLVPQQQALLQGLRPMTVLSKQSGEDYKKMVRSLLELYTRGVVHCILCRHTLTRAKEVVGGCT
jgi:hypothetical protein